MTDRRVLLQTIQGARDPASLASAVAALDADDRRRVAAAGQDRELDHAASMVSRVLTPMATTASRGTPMSDWLHDLQEPALDPRVAMAAEASQWMRSVPRELFSDREEFTQQALGRARTAASVYGERAPAAEAEFLSCVARLSAATAASGLPQIDQVTDPNNQPAQTPYPTEVFDNFAEPQNPYNQGIEGDNGQSQISSQSAPQIQQDESMNGSGSGFGSGPERPDQHSTSMDTSNSYAEVPLGTPGQIPAEHVSPGAAPQASSAPTPVTGPGAQPLDESARKQAAWTPPDPLGFRWRRMATLAEAEELPVPWHQKCAAQHWPDESCVPGQPHLASVALDHSMDMEQWRHLANCQSFGADEGNRAVQAARGSLMALASHHNRLAAAWAATDRTAEDTAVLRGFQAVVRPVLAAGQPPAEEHAPLVPVTASTASPKITLQVEGRKPIRVTEAELRAFGRDFSQAEREELKSKGDTLPGTTKLPITNAQDLENAERLKGKVKGEPQSKIDDYLNSKEKEFGHKASANGQSPNFT